MSTPKKDQPKKETVKRIPGETVKLLLKHQAKKRQGK